MRSAELPFGSRGSPAVHVQRVSAPITRLWDRQLIILDQPGRPQSNSLTQFDAWFLSPWFARVFRSKCHATRCAKRRRALKSKVGEGGNHHTSVNFQEISVMCFACKEGAIKLQRQVRVRKPNAHAYAPKSATFLSLEIPPHRTCSES